MSAQFGPKRITAAIRADPGSLVLLKTQRGGALRGLDAIEELTNAGLTYVKADGGRAPQLAEEVPSLDNGLWKVQPDGTMETTWKIKASATWQDGTPVTADDFLFTTTVEQDKDLEIASYAEYGLIDSIEAADPHTITVIWKQPYIDADTMFSYGAAGMPLPKHILADSYTNDKTNFLTLPFWTDGYVGAGAFTMREWVQDVHATVDAYNGYVFGRPKIDEIEIDFIPDNNALLANILAGTDMTLGKTMSLDMALQAQDQWKGGRVEIRKQNWTPLNPQFIDPDPVIILDYRFRKALFLAIDRQQLTDFVFSGHGAVADSYVSPDTPMYNLIEPRIVKYPYDPRQSAQIVSELGYTKRGDGFLYGADGAKLTVSIRIPTQNDIHLKATAPIADAWQAMGVAVDQVPIPIQRTLDRPYRATFPGFQIVERVNRLDAADVYRFHSSQAPLPENGYRASGFESRYRNPDLDAAIERYVTAIPLAERMRALGDIVHHQTENLSQLPLFYGADPTLVSNRLLNVTARGEDFTQAWNVQDWDLASP